MSSNSAISFPNMQPPGGENALQGIFNNDQGLFQNHGSKKITNIPTLDLAYLTNDNSQNEIDNTINLNPSYLTWNDFITLFYSTTSSGFCISATNANAAPISLFGQTYTTTQNHKSTFSLSQQIIKAWAKKNNKPESSVPIPFRIQLERQNFLTKTLSYVNGFQLGLSLDEVISTLLSQQEIQPADYESYATVQFTINYRDYFCPLDTSLLVVFTFITNIPGYTNGNNPNPRIAMIRTIPHDQFLFHLMKMTACIVMKETTHSTMMTTHNHKIQLLDLLQITLLLLVKFLLI